MEVVIISCHFDVTSDKGAEDLNTTNKYINTVQN